MKKYRVLETKKDTGSWTAVDMELTALDIYKALKTEYSMMQVLEKGTAGVDYGAELFMIRHRYEIIQQMLLACIDAKKEQVDKFKTRQMLFTSDATIRCAEYEVYTTGIYFKLEGCRQTLKAFYDYSSWGCIRKPRNLDYRYWDSIDGLSI